MPARKSFITTLYIVDDRIEIANSRLEMKESHDEMTDDHSEMEVAQGIVGRDS